MGVERGRHSRSHFRLGNPLSDKDLLVRNLVPAECWGLFRGRFLRLISPLLRRLRASEAHSLPLAAVMQMHF